MFTFLKRVLCALVFAGVVFLLVSILSGGNIFRWFGDKVSQKTGDIAREADNIKKQVEGVKGKAHGTIDKTQGIINAVIKE